MGSVPRVPNAMQPVVVMVGSGPPIGSGGRARAIVVLRGQLPGDPVGRWTLTFSSVTVLACVVALASSPWREPVGGTALYWALLGLASASAVLVGGATWRSRRAPGVGGGEAS